MKDGSMGQMNSLLPPLYAAKRGGKQICAEQICLGVRSGDSVILDGVLNRCEK